MSTTPSTLERAGTHGPLVRPRHLEPRHRRARRRPTCRAGRAAVLGAPTSESVDGTSSRPWPSGTSGRSSVGCRVSAESSCRACEPCDSGSSTAASASGGSHSARSAAAAIGVGCGARDQGPRQALEVALPDAAGALELVGVAGRAGCGQLVDVGEDELGEARDLLGVDALGDGGAGEVSPRDAGPDAVRRQQRLHRPAAACLAATEAVGALEGGGQRGAHVLLAGQGEEPAERELDGVADGLAHPPGQCAGVAGHLGDDGLDGALGDLRQAMTRMLAATSGSSPTWVRCCVAGRTR